MQVRIEDVSPVEKKLIVEVPWGTVSDKLGAAFRELGKSVQLKGFRKGKVPRSVLEQMFGKRVKAEVAEELVRESFVTAATQHELQPVSAPKVEEELSIRKGQPFAFEAIVEVRGEVEVSDYAGMELNKRPLAIAESDVDGALDQLQREHTELHPIEGREELAEGDLVAVSLKGSLGEHDVDREITVDLGDPDNEPLPGLCAALIGKPLGAEELELELSIPEDFRDNSIAGETASLVATVLDARMKEVPEIDDEFAKDTGRGENMAELREALQSDLEQRMRERIEGELREAALKELVKRNQIPVAASLIERGIDAKLHRLRSMLGLGPDSNEGLGDEIRENLRESAADEVRGQLLLDAVAKIETIELDDSELAERIEKIAGMQNQQPARLRAEMERSGAIEDLRFQLLQDKTLDFLIEKAEVTEVEPSEEEESEEEAGAEGADAEAPAAPEASETAEGESSED